MRLIRGRVQMVRLHFLVEPFIKEHQHGSRTFLLH
nr:MAG TPA: hypothetical protein [Caudoviricetes sp.]